MQLDDDEIVEAILNFFAAGKKLLEIILQLKKEKEHTVNLWKCNIKQYDEIIAELRKS